MNDTETEKKTQDWARLEALSKALAMPKPARTATEVVADAKVFLEFLNA